MRCTLLNSLERHLALLWRGLTSLHEPEKHPSTSLIWQRLWLMIRVREWEESTGKKSCHSPFFLFISALLWRCGMGWYEPVDKTETAEGSCVNKCYQHLSDLSAVTLAPLSLAATCLSFMQGCLIENVFFSAAQMKPLVCVISPFIHYKLQSGGVTVFNCFNKDVWILHAAEAVIR